MEWSRIMKGKDGHRAIDIDPLKLKCVLQDAAPRVRELDKQIELLRRAPDGSEKQRQAQLRIDDIEQDIAFYARNDLGISGAALAAMVRAEHAPQLKRTVTINAEALAKAEDRYAVATAEMRLAQNNLNAAYTRARAAQREQRAAKAERDLIAAGCEVL